MKPVPKRLTLLSLLLTFVAVVIVAQPSQPGLGKVNFAALYDAAPQMPASPAEASKRTFRPEDANESTSLLDTFYEPYNKKIAAARQTLQPAVDSLPAREQAVSQQAVDTANNSAVIANMGGTNKIAQMSDEEREQAAIQAAGKTVQSMPGAPPQAGAGMQAIMQRMMNDPAYAARFEKMSQAEQEAEMRQAMGAPMAQHSKEEEKRAMQGSDEAAAAKARLDQLGAIHKRILDIDTEFTEKEREIKTSPGNYEEIARATNAKIAKIPMVEMGEAGLVPEPKQYRAVQREHATLARARADWELKQRTALYAKRKTAYQAAATEYANWLKQPVAPATGPTAKMLQDSAMNMAIRCEEALVGLADNLAKYSHEATYDAAQYELAYQKKMSEP